MPKTKGAVLAYRKNPLMDAGCELRFPPILRIGAQPPAGFQERVRQDYPVIQVASDKRKYVFLSEDQQWQVVLDSGSMILVAKRYEEWADFRRRIEGALEALCGEYAPPFFSKVGLRHQMLIRRSALGMPREDWRQILQPPLGGQSVWPQVKGTVRSSRVDAVMQLAGGQDHLRVQHGFVAVRPVKNGDPGELCYLIDYEFFVEAKTSNRQALDKLDTFQEESWRFLRGCVTDRLHEAMEPVTT